MLATQRILEDYRSSDPQIRRYLQRVERLMARLGRLETVEVRRALRLLTDARRRILDELASLPVTADGSLRAVTLRALQLALEQETARFASDYRQSLIQALDDAWALGIELVPETLDALGITLTLAPQISRTQLEIAQGYTVELVRRISDDLRNRITERIRLGVLGGETIASLQRKIAADLRTEPSRYDHRLGPFAIQAERIVRTELQTVFSLANEARQQQLAEQVPGLRKVWLTARDDRVRPAHVTAGNQYAPGGRPGPIPVHQDFIVGGERAKHPKDPRLSPGNRINCRCISMLYHPDWERWRQQAAGADQ